MMAEIRRRLNGRITMDGINDDNQTMNYKSKAFLIWYRKREGQKLLLKDFYPNEEIITYVPAHANHTHTNLDTSSIAIIDQKNRTRETVTEIVSAVKRVKKKLISPLH